MTTFSLTLTFAEYCELITNKRLKKEIEISKNGEHFTNSIEVTNGDRLLIRVEEVV